MYKVLCENDQKMHIKSIFYQYFSNFINFTNFINIYNVDLIFLIYWDIFIYLFLFIDKWFPWNSWMYRWMYTYITIRTPAHKIKSTYVNRHDMPSLTLQAICDADKMFLDVFTGPPSKVHDARIFKLSFINIILPQTCGDEWHILGDATYPLKKFLITPYRDYGNLTEKQRNFNYKFSVCRVKIKNAFGLLKTRFRQLIRLDFNTVQRSCKFIIACCTLHNLCIHNGDNSNDFMEEEVDIVNIPDFEGINRDDNRIEGEEKRNLSQLLR